MRSGKIIFLIALPFFLFLFSCSIQKRHYRGGFYIEKKSSPSNFVSKKINSPEISETKQPSIVNTQEPSAFNEKPAVPAIIKQKIPGLKQKKIFGALLATGPVKNLVLRKPEMKIAFYGGAIPDHVAKAGLRMAIISLLFLAGAYYFFLSYPELVYITVSLLIIAAIFALVSIISAASARKDKINNSKTWLGLALVAIILSVLILCAIALFFILLF